MCVSLDLQIKHKVQEDLIYPLPLSLGTMCYLPEFTYLPVLSKLLKNATDSVRLTSRMGKWVKLLAKEHLMLILVLQGLHSIIAFLGVHISPIQKPHPFAFWSQALFFTFRLQQSQQAAFPLVLL